MPDYVFSLGLIPVQEWISQARRLCDLRAGSVFLWHVMTKVLARLDRESEVSGDEVWTPSLPDAWEGLCGLALGRLKDDSSAGFWTDFEKALASLSACARGVSAT